METFLSKNKFLPLLKSIVTAFSDKFNPDFISVMSFIAMEGPFYKYTKQNIQITHGTTPPSLNQLKDFYKYSKYSITPYLSDNKEVQSIYKDNKDTIIKSNFETTLNCPAYVLSINHKSKEVSIVLSIRGTQSIIDVLYDLDIEPVPFQSGFIHKGMLTGAYNIISSIGRDIDKTVMQHPHYKFTVTGHSLGAGFASIYALLEKSRYPTLQCYCYAPPSCMSESLAKKLEPYVFSVVNNYDVIPRVNTKALHQYKTELEKLDLSILSDINSELWNDTYLQQIVQSVDEFSQKVDKYAKYIDTEIFQPLKDALNYNESTESILSKEKSLRELLDNLQKKPESITNNNIHKSIESPISKLRHKHRLTSSKDTQSTQNEEIQEYSSLNRLKNTLRYRGSSKPKKVSFDLIPFHKQSSNKLIIPDIHNSLLVLNTEKNQNKESYSSNETIQESSNIGKSIKQVDTKELNRLLLKYYRETVDITNQYSKAYSVLLKDYCSSLKESNTNLLKYECSDTKDVDLFQLHVKEVIESCEKQKLDTLSKLYSLNESLKDSLLATRSDKLLLSQDPPYITKKRYQDQENAFSYICSQLAFINDSKVVEDFFPYHQLSPPGTIYHIMNTPRSPFFKTTLNLVDCFGHIYDFPTKQVPIVSTNTKSKNPEYFKYDSKSDKESCIKLTDREEFYKIYGVETLLEDHRVINYIWNLKYLVTLNSKSGENYDYKRSKLFSLASRIFTSKK